MKKQLITLALLLASFFVNGQSRLGFTSKQIIEEFGSRHKVRIEYLDNGDLTVCLEIQDKCNVYYMFLDKSTTCNAVVIEPISQGYLNFLVEMYNKQCVIINETKWKMYYENGGIANVSLISKEKKSPVFVWTISE